MVVADIGAGSGYYSSRIAKRVGPPAASTTDIQPGMIEMLERRIKSEGLPTSPRCWAAWTIPSCRRSRSIWRSWSTSITSCSSRRLFLQRLKDAFKPGGRLVLLEFRKEDPKVPILEVHKMSVAEVKQEMEAEGFVLDKVIETLPWQHIIVLKAVVRLRIPRMLKGTAREAAASSSAPSS